MKFYSKLLLYVGLLVIAGTSLTSCKKDNETSGSVVKFSELSKTVTEADGNITLALDFGSATTSDLVLQFSLSGTAVLNGDYLMNTATATNDTTITIAKGSTTANLIFKVIDDKVIESSKTLIVTLKNVSSGGTLSTTSLDLTSTVTITDNDTAPTSGIQADLTWNAGSKVELDLYLLTGVEFDSNGNITSVDQTNSLYSANTEGFQSITLPTTATDGNYYIYIGHAEGTRTATYTINLNGGGFTNESDTYTIDAGAGLYYTSPIVKSGSTYTFSQEVKSILKKNINGKTVQILKITKKSTL
ncbi:MAG: hypothetical protein QM669_02815 [Siphonobacter sp.]